MNNIEYVIYCRKSTDESSDNQKQSIPDQIRTCIEYANREKLNIQERPKDQLDLESEIDKMVYELYGLSDDEIRVVEDSLK